MKKMIFLLLFLCTFLFAESGNFMFVGIDTGYLIEGVLKGGYGIGGNFEVKLLNNFSVNLNGGYIDYLEKLEGATNKIGKVRAFGTLRWYQGGAIDGVFAGIGFGSVYNFVNSDTLTGYILPLELGLKLLLPGKKNGFSFEPDVTFFLMYINSKFAIDMKYGINIGYTF